MQTAHVEPDVCLPGLRTDGARVPYQVFLDPAMYEREQEWIPAESIHSW